MGYQTEWSTIEQRFNTNWSETPIAWTNIKLDTSLLDEFVRITIEDGPAQQVTFGLTENAYRHSGDIVIQIFVRPDTGTQRVTELVDSIAAIFRSISVSDRITFRTPEAVSIGESDGWFQVNVVCDFYRTEYL